METKECVFFVFFFMVLVLGERGVRGRVRRRRRRRRVGPVLCNRKGEVGGLWWVVVVDISEP